MVKQVLRNAPEHVEGRPFTFRDRVRTVGVGRVVEVLPQLHKPVYKFSVP